MILRTPSVLFAITSMSTVPPLFVSRSRKTSRYGIRNRKKLTNQKKKVIMYYSINLSAQFLPMGQALADEQACMSKAFVWASGTIGVHCLRVGAMAQCNGIVMFYVQETVSRVRRTTLDEVSE